MIAHAATPSLFFTNGRFYTGIGTGIEPPWAQAVAIRGNTILAVGAVAEVEALIDPNTRRIDLGGRLALPGLCDAHIHLYAWALGRQRLNLAAARSKAEMLTALSAYAAQRGSYQWVIGQGWNESWWDETSFPTATDLDRATPPGIPVICLRSDMHMAVANGEALRRAGIAASTPNPDGGLIDRDASGSPTGILREQAIRLVMSLVPPPPPRELEAALLAAQTELHRLGITAVHDQRVKDGDEGPRMLATLSALASRSALRLRVNCNLAAHQLPALATLGLRSGFGNDVLRLGHVKVFADGSLGSRTAWMLAPFVPETPGEPDNYGVSVTLPEQMAAEFAQATALGFPVSVHAIGDHANRVVLDIFAELHDRSATLAIPHRIEHAQTLDPSDLPRLAQLSITASVQPIHLVDDLGLTDRLLGERGRYTYAFGSLYRTGAELAFGSDAPVADANPFLGIHAAAQRRPPSGAAAWFPDERLPMNVIVDAYTSGPAHASGWQDIIGTLAPGKRADLIVVDRDLFALNDDPERAHGLAATEVVLTVFDGAIVYRSPRHDLAA
jgi:predicted amidohydrolase YtcJ